MDKTENLYLLSLHLETIPHPIKKYILMDYKENLEVFFHDSETNIKNYLARLSNREFKTISQEYRNRLVQFSKKQIELAKKQNVQILDIYHEDYPNNLLQIEDYPICLYVKGKLLKEDINSISIVGSRKFSDLGQRNVYELSFNAAKSGLTVISGLAKGIDGIAHKAALDAKGRTIAVLGCGVDYIYPFEHKELYHRIYKEDSVILSEFSLGSKPFPFHFPQRNRIIAGLSLGTVLIEGSLQSGALYTVDHALNYGREIYTYPGPANSLFYGANHKLLRDGAKLIENFADLKEDLKLVLDFEYIDKHLSKVKEEKDTEFIQNNNEEIFIKKIDLIEDINEDQKSLLKLLLKEAKTTDQIIDESTFSPNQVMMLLSLLEIDKYCFQKGNLYFFNKKRL